MLTLTLQTLHAAGEPTTILGGSAPLFLIGAVVVLFAALGRMRRALEAFRPIWDLLVGLILIFGAIALAIAFTVTSLMPH